MKTNILILKVVLIEIVVIILLVKIFNSPYFDSDKEKFDRAVSEYWHDWKASGKDTVNCIVDFDKIMPFEWDTLVYCENSFSEEVCNYEFENGLKNDKIIDYPYLHFLNKKKIVHKMNLFRASDDFTGVYFNIDESFIKRARGDAKFHVKKECESFIISDRSR
jgi:hypothetical protein